MPYNGCPDCEVIREAMSPDEAFVAVAGALAEMCPDTDLHGDLTFAEIGLTDEQVRRVWGGFFVACDVDMTWNADGTITYLHPEQLPPLPRTVGDLVQEVYRANRGTTFRYCDNCWCPG